MEAAIKNESIRVREVYLSDLTSVVNLYSKGSANKLTIDFGLPLGVAEQHGKIIACACVNIDSTGKPIFSIHSNTLVEVNSLCENLNSFSVKRLAIVWGIHPGEVPAIKPVQNAINRLVDWLNHCS